MSTVSQTVAETATRARRAAVELGRVSTQAKDEALRAMAAALAADASGVLAANTEDVRAAQQSGTPAAIVDRLRLDDRRIRQMADGLQKIADLTDPVGEVVRGYTLPNGLQLRQLRVPFGVVGIIYEARPNVTVDAAGLTLKSGNAVLLRGSGSASRSNAALVQVLRKAVEAHGLPADAVQLVPGEGHEAATDLMRARGLVDVLIPRGGAGLIRRVVEESMVPVIETGVGNCHVYVDAAADPEMALRILLNAKTDRPSVCNAAETVLVHADIADAFVPRALAALAEAGVAVRGDARTLAYAEGAYAETQAYAGDGGTRQPATDADWDTEYLDLRIAAAVVDDFDEAVAHIRTHGSGHSEAIVTDSQGVAQRFVREVDAAAVLVNASTRFTDGGEFGFGAEIGISTQKLHARGPMGLGELTSTKYVVIGEGHTR